MKLLAQQVSSACRGSVFQAVFSRVSDSGEIRPCVVQVLFTTSFLGSPSQCLSHLRETEATSSLYSVKEDDCK